MAENPLSGKSIWRKIHLAENPLRGTKFPPNGLSAKWIFRDKNRCQISRSRRMKLRRKKL